jgi:hypothetical protein
MANGVDEEFGQRPAVELELELDQHVEHLCADGIEVIQSPANRAA